MDRLVGSLERTSYWTRKGDPLTACEWLLQQSCYCGLQCACLQSEWRSAFTSPRWRCALLPVSQWSQFCRLLNVMSRTVVVRRSTAMRRRVVWSVMRRLFFTNFLICWNDFEFGPDARVASLVPFTCDLRVIFIFWWGSAVLQSGLCPLCIVLGERSEHCSGLSWIGWATLNVALTQLAWTHVTAASEVKWMRACSSIRFPQVQFWLPSGFILLPYFILVTFVSALALRLPAPPIRNLPMLLGPSRCEGWRAPSHDVGHLGTATYCSILQPLQGSSIFQLSTSRA